MEVIKTFILILLTTFREKKLRWSIEQFCAKTVLAIGSQHHPNNFMKHHTKANENKVWSFQTLLNLDVWYFMSVLVILPLF